MRVVVKLHADMPGSMLVLELEGGLAAFFYDDGRIEVHDAYPDLWRKSPGWLVFK